MFELLVAAKLFLASPQTIVGNDRAKIEERFGAPDSVGTDFRPVATEGALPDQIVTLDWPQLRIRLYVSAATQKASLLGVTTTSDVLKLDSSIRIGCTRNTVVSELGEPLFEDETHVVYGPGPEELKATGPTVRIVFKDGRVVGIDWTFPIGD